jgi:hypothetical protein
VTEYGPFNFEIIVFPNNCNNFNVMYDNSPVRLEQFASRKKDKVICFGRYYEGEAYLEVACAG